MGAIIDIPSYEAPIDTKVLRGLPSTLVDLPPVVAIEGSDQDGPYSEIVVPDNFPPGSIMLFATQLQGVDPNLDEFCKSGVDEAFKDLNVIDLNVLLFRCEGEERDATGESVFEHRFAIIHGCGQMAKSELTMYLDSESSSIVDCRGGWPRFVILCSTTTSVTLYASTFVRGLGRWTTSPTDFSSKH